MAGLRAHDEAPPKASECWRVVEIYGSHRVIGGVRQVVTAERWHGPYMSEAAAKRASSLLARNSASQARNGEVAGYFAVEKGTIQWQEN